MPANNYNVLPSQVTDRLGSGAGLITATTRTLSIGKIQDFIDEASATITGTLVSVGVLATPDTSPSTALDAVTLKQCQTAIIHYALAESLSTLSRVGPEVDSAWRKWRDALDAMQTRPQHLAKRVNRTRANFSTSSNRSSQFAGTDYEF